MSVGFLWYVYIVSREFIVSYLGDCDRTLSFMLQETKVDVLLSHW